MLGMWLRFGGLVEGGCEDHVCRSMDRLRIGQDIRGG
jgi:hypothetical protein